ncbi:hypothetical protein NPIL_33061 [Nephila pilipes]|uniref:Uncharacterized protein n=1 Tax=Nephila pilipes TaxID=299642 RepID=A0A8X6NBE9_NEPPI|nr:hypothetical protein NPIL_33061 [Nephila pilipes]
MALSTEAEINERIKRILPCIPDAIAYRNDTSAQSSILHYATDAAMVKHIILRNGADPNARTRFLDETPLMTAIKLQRPPEVIRELLIHGAKTDMRSKHIKSTPLNLAANVPNCNIEIVKLLLEHGADVDTLNKFHDTPLIHAIRNFSKNMDLIKTFLQAGASINLENLKGETPLITAMKNSRCTVELFRELLKYKADANSKDKTGSTPLHYAIQCLKNNKFKIVKELMKRGCDINARDVNGITPLICAIHHTRNRRTLAFCKCLIRYTVLKNNAKYSEMSDTHRTVVHDRIHNYISASQKEVNFMKKHIIDDGISMYDYVMSKTVRTTLGDKLLETLENGTYRVYNDLILRKAKRAALLNLLCENRIYTHASRGNTTQKITLDGDSVLNIGMHLKIYELENLVDAYGWDFKEINGPSSSRQLKRPAEEIFDVITKPQPFKRKKFSKPIRRSNIDLIIRSIPLNDV